MKVVLLTYAVVNPDTVVVETGNTTVADPAVFGSGRSLEVARATPLRLIKMLIIIPLVHLPLHIPLGLNLARVTIYHVQKLSPAAKDPT